MSDAPFSFERAPRRARVALSLLAATCILAVAFHFTATLLYLAPLNPLKVDIQRPVERYMLPWFGQKWELFAPDPRAKSHYLLVACRVPQEDGSIKETPWFDTTTRLYEQHYRNRLAPGDRIARVELSILHFLIPQTNELYEEIKKMPHDAPDVKAALEQMDKANDAAAEIGRRELARVASVECDRQYGVGAAAQVRGRILTIETPHFRDRYAPLDSGARTTYDLEWLPYERVSNY